MSITIPQGGTVAGRSASVQGLDQQADIGGFVSQVGSAVAEKMGKIKAQQRAVKYSQTELAMTKELGHEYQRVAQYTDPAQIEAEWPQIEATIRDKYVNAKDENGQPLLTPDEANALGLTLGGLSVKHGFNLGARSIELTQSQATAAWMEARPDIVNEAATADRDTLGAFIEFGEARIAELGQQTGKGEAEIVAEQQAFRAEVSNARATTALDQDPIAFISAAEEGVYDDLGPERVAQLKVTAQAEAARRAAAEAKAMEAAATESNRIVGQKLKDISGVVAKGGSISTADRDLLQDPAYQAHPDYGQAIAAVTLADEKPNLNYLPPAELRKLLDEEKAKPDSAPYQVERQIYLENLLAEAEKGWATDGAAQAKKSGLPIPDLDPENLEDLPEALSKRIAYGIQLNRDGYVNDPRQAILDETERAALKAITAPTADLEPKMALALALARGTEGNAEWLTRLIGADPVFAEATRVMTETGSEELARTMLRGQQKVESGNVILPPAKDIISVFNEVTGGAYEDDPIVAARIRNAAMAVYADTARGINPEGVDSRIPFMDDEEAKAAVGTAIRQVTGASPDAEGNLTVGGLQPFRDAMVKLPPGVPLADLESAMDNIEEQLAGRAFHPDVGDWVSTSDMEGKPFLSDGPPDPLRAFRAASIDGRVPEMSSDVLGTLQIEKVPGRNDQYRFVYPSRGRLVPIGDSNGVEYRFRLPDLIRGARQ